MRVSPLPLAAVSALSLCLLTGCGSSGSSTQSAASVSPACTPLRAKYPSLQGRTFTNATNPHTPGYEALDPNDPSRYVGFDIDLGTAIGQCLGFKIAYKSVAFPALLPTLQSGQADLVISDIYATSARAKAADFITYSKVYDGVLVRNGNPKKITGIDTSLCGATAALNTGFVEVPMVQNLASACSKAGKPPAAVQLYDNNAQCAQAILAGQADTYINDVNTVDEAVKSNPGKLANAATLKLPFSIGIAVRKNDTSFRSAVMAALTVVQQEGTERALLKKWSLDASQQEAPRLVVD